MGQAFVSMDYNDYCLISQGNICTTSSCHVYAFVEHYTWLLHLLCSAVLYLMLSVVIIVMANGGKTQLCR